MEAASAAAIIKDETELLVPDILKSSPHDVNGEDAALMSREQIIDEVADDRIRFVAQLRDDAANECAAARVPFQIDRAMRIVRAVDFGPAMRAARAVWTRL